jgi:nitrate/nitrite transporter NarK
VFCTFALFWTLPTAFLSGTAAAGGIALINAIGNLAGFGGPYLIGWVKERSGSTAPGLLLLAIAPLVAGVIVLLLKHDRETEFATAARER